MEDKRTEVNIFFLRNLKHFRENIYSNNVTKINKVKKPKTQYFSRRYVKNEQKTLMYLHVYSIIPI